MHYATPQTPSQLPFTVHLPALLLGNGSDRLSTDSAAEISDLQIQIRKSSLTAGWITVLGDKTLLALHSPQRSGSCSKSSAGARPSEAETARNSLISEECTDAGPDVSVLRGSQSRMALAPEVRAAASQGGGSSSSREMGGCFSEGRADCSLWNQAAGRAGAAGAEFSSVASCQGVELWTEAGA